MHGLGNDFVMVEDRELSLLAAKCNALAKDPIKCDALWLRQFCSKLAAHICNRNLGVGGDGLIVAIDIAQMKAKSVAGESFYRALELFTADYPGLDHCQVAWIYVNSDGSYSAMCGNGLRCLTLFVSDLGWLKNNEFSVATSVYPVAVEITPSTAPGGDTMTVKTRLAGPIYEPSQVPLAASSNNAESFIEQPISVAGRTLFATCLSMGNPHCVIFEQDGLSLSAYAADIEAAHRAGRPLQKFPDDLLQLAGDIQKLSLFPEGVNVEFVRTSGQASDTACVFVLERGCGATLACASGAAAVLAAGVISKRLNKKSYVILPGGKLEVSLSCADDQGCMQKSDEYIELTGPATRAFVGDATVPASLFLEGVCI